MNDIERQFETNICGNNNSEKPRTYGVGCDCYSTRITNSSKLLVFKWKHYQSGTNQKQLHCRELNSWNWCHRL